MSLLRFNCIPSLQIELVYGFLERLPLVRPRVVDGAQLVAAQLVAEEELGVGLPLARPAVGRGLLPL